MTPYKTLIIDDEPAAREVIRSLMAETPALTIVDEAANGVEAIQKILHHRPDLIFLDIQMPKLNGFGVLQHIWPDHQPTIVFTTAFDQYAIQAFEVNAIDYLLKPFDEMRFGQSVNRALERLHGHHQPDVLSTLTQLLAQAPKAVPHEYPTRLLVKELSRMYFVNLADVHYLDADGNYITLHTATGKHTIYESLTKLETWLDPANFVRIHRSYIINVNYVKEVETHVNGDHITRLSNGKTLKWTRNYRDNMQVFLNKVN